MTENEKPKEKYKFEILDEGNLKIIGTNFEIIVTRNKKRKA
jgi:hypothetical protein